MEHFIERAIRYRKQLKGLGVSQSELARQIGIGQPKIANHLRVLSLNNEVLKNIKYFGITFSRTLKLVSVKDKLSKEQMVKIVRYSFTKQIGYDKFCKLVDKEVSKLA